uniref:Penicillin-binding protein 1F n=1 Tax=Anthurium amnicola TaxID=1678845 RepID=A0A1D1XXT5_9ARAE
MLLPAANHLPFPVAAAARSDILHSTRPTDAFPSRHFPSSSRSRCKRLHLEPIFAAHSQEPHSSSPGSTFTSALSFRFRDALLFFLFVVAILGARPHLGLLFPRDFSDRWRRLLAFSEEAESECAGLPQHLVQAIVASEDRRFFRHAGVDPIGLARAVVFFPRGGGGSTITQQLVKNVFLKKERKLSRKVVEIFLALILERKMSKQRILYSYMSKIYWGHGNYGIKSASIYYFGKQPSLLSLGESAMLSGMLPAPEIFSPFKHKSRGKFSQARALRKMVEAGFIDIKVALLVVSQTLHFHSDELENAFGHTRKQAWKSSFIDKIWDWENASIVWEAREYLESWAMRKHKQWNFLSQK